MLDDMCILPISSHEIKQLLPLNNRPSIFWLVLRYLATRYKWLVATRNNCCNFAPNPQQLENREILSVSATIEKIPATKTPLEIPQYAPIFLCTISILLFECWLSYVQQLIYCRGPARRGLRRTALAPGHDKTRAVNPLAREKVDQAWHWWGASNLLGYVKP